MAVKAIEEIATQAAERVLGHLEGERLIPRFIDSYVMGFDRPQLKNPPEQFRERSNRIGREALVLMGLLVCERCGERLYRFRLGPLKLRDTDAAERLSAAFWQAMGEELKLRPEQAAELRLGTDDYRDPQARAEVFRQRIAPLLDPAPQMKDKAEHAGQKFYEALDKVATQVATRLFSS
ncbi:MAG TPA: hypothetical protein VNN18_05595 [Candidatus Xenobia bacterium]|nr:hypothetical protein [Candidatus Xenobia bacterium]